MLDDMHTPELMDEARHVKGAIEKLSIDHGERTNCGWSRDEILRIRDALRNDSAGNQPATMTDMDFAVQMLDELLQIKYDR
jgi:hypothetical protein